MTAQTKSRKHGIFKNYSVQVLDFAQMAFCSPSTPAKLAVTIACFLGSGALFAYGVHLSYLNVGPQQARTKARNDFVKDRIRKKYGK